MPARTKATAQADPTTPTVALSTGHLFRGGSWEVLHTQMREVVISGAAGTGKSIACLTKLKFLCERVPNLRCLMIRKTRASLSESGLVSWEQKVLGENHPALREGGKRSHRKSYDFPNGSTVVVGGMDKPSKILSTEFDCIYVQEAIELEEQDWETLISRNRNFKLGYQQIIADTNPDTPTHWIKQREAAGKLHLIESHHEDNPLLFDPQRNEWTGEGRRYLEALDQLTGPRFLRLRRGVWCQAEGAVYEDFDRGVHVVDSICGHPYPPPEWIRYLAIDFGFTNAFVCHFCAVDPDGRLWVYRQWIKSQMLVEDHAKQIKVMMAEEDRYLRHQIIQRRKEMIERLGESEGARWMVNSIGELPRQLRPRAVICDHDAEDRATLERHLGMATKAANKQIRAGIQAVASRLRRQGDGRPRLYILRDSVGKPDANMVAKKLPVGIAEEMEGYVWDVESGRKKGEEPVGKNDHSCLIAGTLVATIAGDVPIEEISAGDMVLTRDGFRPVVCSGKTSDSATVFEVAFSNGAIVNGTGNHPIHVVGSGFVPIEELEIGSVVTTYQSADDGKGIPWEEQCRGLKLSYSTGSSFGDILIPSGRRTGCTLRLMSTLARRASVGFTKRSGRRRTARFLRDGMSTTLTATPSTTASKIWNVCRNRSTIGFMGRSLARSVEGIWWRSCCPSLGKPQKSGMQARLAWSGIESTARRCSVWTEGTEIRLPSNANGAVAILSATASPPSGMAMRFGSVRACASPRLVAVPASMPWPSHANGAAASSRPTSIRGGDTAPVRVLRVRTLPGEHRVYNLTIDGTPEYFANGVLVHNCDALRYMVAELDLVRRGTAEVWS